MKTLILAGGYGTRLIEETRTLPKPMIEVGGKPILWHIMKTYSHYGFRDFVVLLGYRGFVIKEYFANFFLHSSDVTFDLARNEMIVHKVACEPWRVTLLDTGDGTLTGGRVLRAREAIGDEPFMLTYGDGLGNVDRPAEEAHRRRASHGHALPVGAGDAHDRFVDGRRPTGGSRHRKFERRMECSFTPRHAT